MRKNVVNWENEIFIKTAENINGPVWWGEIVRRIEAQNKISGYTKIYAWPFPRGWIPGRPYRSIACASVKCYRYYSGYAAGFEIGPIWDGYQTVKKCTEGEADLKEVATLYPEDALIARYPTAGPVGCVTDHVPVSRLLTNGVGDCYVMCAYTWIGDKRVACEPEFADLYCELKTRYDNNYGSRLEF